MSENNVHNASTINGDVNNSSSNDIETAAAKSFKAPAFWKTNPELWFKQVESQFYTLRITSDARKFHFIVAAMESEILAQVSDIVLNPPDIFMYETLKKRLIERFSQSEQFRLKKLLTEIELGDQKPSHLLSDMKELANGKVSDDLLKTLWVQRLPTQVRAILSVSSDSLSNLASMADKIIEVAEIKNDFSQISTAENMGLSRAKSAENEQINVLQTQIASLTRKVEEMGRARSQSRGRKFDRISRNASKSPSYRSTSQPRFEFCWYHHKFGSRATKCREPCNFKSDSGN